MSFYLSGRAVRSKRLRALPGRPLFATAAALSLVFTPLPALAQSIWTPGNSHYNTTTNWNNSTPPVSAGQSAQFGANGGNFFVTVDSAIAPDSWTFTSAAQTYLFTGSAVTFGGSGITDNANNQTISIANNIAGSGGITQADTGGGTIFLSGTNTYSGATTITSGILRAGSTSAFGTNSAVTLSAGSTLDLGGFSNSIGSLTGTGGTVTDAGGAATLTTGGDGTSTSFSGSLQDGTGALSLTKTGSGTLTLSGTNSNSGATTVTSGVLAAGSTGAFSSGSAFTVNGTLDISGFSNTIASLAGIGTVTDSGAAAILTVGGSSSTSFSGALTGANLALTVGGTGKLTLLGNTNTYTGATVINNGATLALSGTGSIASSSSVTDNGTFDISAATATVNIVSLSGSGSVVLGGSTLQLTNASGTFAGSLTGTSGSVFQIAGGTEVLSGTNTYSGATTITSGTLTAGSATAFSPNSAFTVNGTLDIAGNAETIGALSGSGAVTNSVSGTQILTIGGSASTTFSGTIQNGTGNTGLTYAGTGTLTLSNANNTFSGSATINSGGTVSLSGAGTIGTAAVVDNGVLDISQTTSGISLPAVSGSGSIALGAKTLTLTSSSTFAGVIQDGGIGGGTGGNLTINTGGAGVTLTGANTYTGTTTITSGTLTIGNGGTTGAIGTGPIVNNAFLNFNLSVPVTVNGAISGSGPLGNIGSSVLTLTAVNGYSGATSVGAGATIALSGGGTIVSSNQLLDAGTFDISQIGASGASITSLSGAGTVALGSKTLTLTSATQTFSGVIQDGGIGGGTGGALVVSGGGTETLTGANTYTGGTTITTGTTLNAGAGSAIPTLGSGGIADAGTLTFAFTSGTGTFANVISGTGVLKQTGSGTTILTGNNSSLTGTTTISAGTLQIGNGGTSGTLSANGITDNAALVFNRSDSITVSNAISGSGTLTQAGSGTLILTAVDPYGATIINSGGTLQVGNGVSISTLGLGGITNNGSLIINEPTTITYFISASISGSGSLTQMGAGSTLNLGTTETYTGATTIGAGSTLQMGNNGSVASSSGVTDNGVFDISVTTASGSSIQSLAGSGSVTTGTGGGAKSLTITAASGTFSGVISGGGAVTISGGNQTITGANTYTGGTTINSGASLILGQGGSVVGNIADNGLLGYNQSGTVTITSLGNVSGSGSIAQSGSGTLIVDTAVPLTGTSSVTSGTLEVGDANTPTASLAGGVNVASGGTLEGHGTINGAVTVASGGTIRPGGSIGTLTVTGAVSIPAGSTFTEEFSNSAASKLAASGAVTLGGNLVLVADSTTYTSGTDYRFITGSSVTSTFASVSGAPSGYTTNVQYSASAVDLIITAPAATPAATPAAATPAATPAAATPAATPAAATPAAAAIASAPAGSVIATYLFNSYGQTPNQIAAGAALTASAFNAPLYVAAGTVVKNNSAAVPAALDSLSGEIHASLRTALVEDDRIIRTAMIDHLGAVTPDQTFSIWGAPYVSYESVATDGNAGEMHHTNAGFIAGADMQVVPDLRLGIEGAIVSQHLSIPTRASSAHGTTGHFGVYGSWSDDAWDVKLGTDMGWGSDNISRAVSLLPETDTSKQSHQLKQIFGDAGYKIEVGPSQLEPYLDIASVQARTGAFTEAGGALSDLTGAARTDSGTYSTLGLRVTPGSFDLGDGMTLAPKVTAGWQHSFNTFLPQQSEGFVSTGTTFLVSGAPLDNDALVSSLGLDLGFAGGGDLLVSYDGLVSGRVESDTVKAQLKWAF